LLAHELLLSIGETLLLDCDGRAFQRGRILRCFAFITWSFERLSLRLQSGNCALLINHLQVIALLARELLMHHLHALVILLGRVILSHRLSCRLERSH